MANRNAPNGFSPVKTKDGHNTAKIGLYYIPATDGTAVGIGDLVKLTTGSDPLGNPTVTRVSANTDLVLGAVVGFQFDPNNLMNKYRLANTARYVYVADDPEAVYEAQVIGAGNFAVADVGYNFSFTVSGGVNTTTGVSNEGVDYATKAVTATLPFQAIALSTVQNNTFGQYARVILRLNNPQMGFATVGI